MSPLYRLVEADSAAHYAAARVLIEDYAAQIGASMGADLCFQSLAAELDRLPLMYGPPSGCLLLAGCDDEWVGCCALRRFSAEICEMKRLYVKASARGAHLGRRLTQHLVTAARTLGYRRMVLDTLEAMIAARTLYGSLGFQPIKAYYNNPLAGVSYMELDLFTATPAVPRS
jgi:GNAT superfamily N-acetyltransferase